MKHSKVEACIICGDMPCSCYAKRKTPSPRTRKPKDPQSSSEILCGPQQPTPEDLAVVEDFKQQLRSRFKSKAQPKPADMGYEFETAQAIRNLESAGLLTDTAKAKYKDVIKPTPTGDLDRRLADWRRRNVVS